MVREEQTANYYIPTTHTEDSRCNRVYSAASLSPMSVLVRVSTTSCLMAHTSNVHSCEYTANKVYQVSFPYFIPRGEPGNEAMVVCSCS